MSMTVMNIGVVTMAVNQFFVNVRMAVWLSQDNTRIMFMLMMLVMKVHMLVAKRLVNMLVFMPFSYVKPYTNTHENCGGDEVDCERIVQEYYRQRGTYKWGQRKIGARSSRTNVPQGKHKECETDPITQKSHKSCSADRQESEPRTAAYSRRK